MIKMKYPQKYSIACRSNISCKNKEKSRLKIMINHLKLLSMTIKYQMKIFNISNNNLKRTNYKNNKKVLYQMNIKKNLNKKL